MCRAEKKRAQIEFDKFNFASDYNRCRFGTLHKSTTISNKIIESGMLDLSIAALPTVDLDFPRTSPIRPIIVTVFFSGAPGGQSIIE